MSRAIFRPQRGLAFLAVTGLTLASLAAEANLMRTKDGLTLKLSRDGFIQRMALGEHWLRLNGFHGGLHVRDAHNPDVPYGVEVEQTSAKPPTFQMNIAELFLGASVRYTATPGFIAIDIDIVDQSGRPRALDISYALPVGEEDWVWWESLRRPRKIELREQYRVLSAPSPIGGAGQLSRYPFCALSGPKGLGLSLAVPPSHPRCYQFGYEGGQLSATFHLGLSPDAGALSGKASVRLLLYRHDPDWGLRDAARLYAEYGPEYFERQTPRKGAALFNLSAATIDGASPEGALRPSALHGICAAPISSVEGAAAEEAPGLAPYLSMSALVRLRYFSIYPDSPGYAEGLLKHLGDPVIQAEVQPYWGSRANLAKIIKNSLARMRNRWPALYGFRPDLPNKNTVAQRELNFLLNLAPDLLMDEKEESSFTAGRHLLSFAQQSFEARPGLAGICLHDIAAASGALNFNREHYPYTKTPLCYDRATQRPVLANQFSIAELLAELRDRSRSGGPFQGKKIWLHGDFLARARALPLLLLGDLISFEAPPLTDGFPEKSDDYDWLRVMALAKPLFAIAGSPLESSLLSGPDFGKQLSALLRWHTFYGVPFSPGKLWANEKAQPELKRRLQDLERHIAITSELQAAGWRPVPHALSDQPEIWVERFGDAGDDLYLTVLNRAAREAKAAIKLDSKTLKLRFASRTKARELTRQAEVKVASSAGTVVLRATVPPTDCLVIQLTK